MATSPRRRRTKTPASQVSPGDLEYSADPVPEPPADEKPESLEITHEDVQAAASENRTERPDTAPIPAAPNDGVMVYAINGFSRAPGRHGKVPAGEIVPVTRKLADHLIKHGVAREVPSV